MCFAIGPMCAVSRTSSEPPSHLECAEFSAKACPFLTRPRMRRNDHDLPEQHTAAGYFIARNPGVTALWVTRHFSIFRPHAGGAGVLFKIGDPERVLWFAQGRTATREEVMTSIESGFPTLLDLAQQEGQNAIPELSQQRSRVDQLLPAA